MVNEQIRESGLRERAKISPKSRDIDKFKSRLIEYKSDNAYPDDGYIWLADVLALEAVSSGNFGVGRVLTNADGNVVAQAITKFSIHTSAATGTVKWRSWMSLRMPIRIFLTRPPHTV